MALFEKKPSSPPLTREEREKALRKIRAEYNAYEEFFASKEFDVSHFNVRYQKALDQGVDIERFLMAEVTALEELKYVTMELYKEGKWRPDAKDVPYEGSFEKKVDDLIRKFEIMIEKYPLKTLCEGASEEIERLYGALSEFASLFSLLKTTMKETNDYSFLTEMHKIEMDLIEYIVSHSGKPPKKFEDYALAVARGSDERQRPTIVMIGAFLNTKVIPLVKGAVARMDNIDSAAPVKLPPGYAESAPRIAASFRGKKQGDVLLGTLAYANSIVKDFRLKDFK